MEAGGYLNSPRKCRHLAKMTKCLYYDGGYLTSPISRYILPVFAPLMEAGGYLNSPRECLHFGYLLSVPQNNTKPLFLGGMDPQKTPFWGDI